MLIYRLHHKGYVDSGIYRGDQGTVGILENTPTTSRHPTPWMDAGLEDQWDDLVNKGQQNEWYFAFASKEQLRSWVYSRSFRELLEQEDVVISEIETDHVIVGDAQAIFNITEEWRVTKTILPTRI